MRGDGTHDDSPNDKRALRVRMSAVRDALRPAERAAAAESIATHLSSIVPSSSRLAGFCATRNEVDLWPYFASLLANGVSVCFPRVVGPGRMVFADVATRDDLVTGAYGILEPTGEPVSSSDITTFLVPGLAFDHRGGRLGFGGGFYDRALSERQRAQSEVPLFVGIGYRCQVLSTELPLQPWDVRMHVVVTEEAVITPGRGDNGETS